MRITRHLAASPALVYRALTDPACVQQWQVPDGMTSEVHAFEAVEGGAFRISLTYESPAEAGKSSAHTDTHHGRFVKLLPGERVEQVMEFETTDPAMQGEMRVTYELSDERSGTKLVASHENVPPGVSPEDNEQGWNMSLDKLAALVRKLASDPH